MARKHRKHSSFHSALIHAGQFAYIKNMDRSIWHLDFPQEYLHSALFVSLLSVWVLVGLFFYLNYYTRREYFTIWTAAWLFYALWLTLGLRMDGVLSSDWMALLRQSCV